jgi:NAD(P)-dependent dehydrogenase (short-subunit alcohol dehydrogenase family)
MQQGDGGSIINISSVSGIRPSPKSAAYGASKAGLVNFTMTAGMEWAPKVRVNCVTAGMVKTETAHLYYGDEAGVAAVAATVPVKRLMDPSDVGDVCVYLASPFASYVTGANLIAHGGGEWPPFWEASNA